MPAEERPNLPVRQVTDARSMRALSHPLRLRILEQLALRGPLTATECAALVGESPSSCSFHLRQLAKYGFVEEAEGGQGRNRPWRSVAVGHRWDAGPDSTAGERAASQALTAQFRRHDAELYAEYKRTEQALAPEWRDAAMEVSFNGYLTAEELRALEVQLVELWRPYAERIVEARSRPRDARLVHLDAVGFPRADDRPADDQPADQPPDDHPADHEVDERTQKKGHPRA
jgi:DNA-binding transcriptional ArsR family regulator